MLGNNEREFLGKVMEHRVRRFLFAGITCACLLPGVVVAQSTTMPLKPATVAHAVTLLSAAELASVVPPSVFFHGKLAPVQMRNSGAIRWQDDSLFWASMVDTSGYASDVQEVYQFYFVTEQLVMIGDKMLPAGAYGAGVVAGMFSVMDVGGHTLLTVPADTDNALQRPRPLQIVVTGPDTIRLYLGRRWVMIQLAKGTS